MISLFKIGENGQKMLNGKLCLLLLCAVIGIVLILIGSGTSAAAPQDEPPPYTAEDDEVVIYQKYLENRIRTLCESVNGVSRVTVAVTLSGGFESLYATELHDGNEEYGLLGSGANAKALYLGRIAPTVVGIGIVCKGVSEHTRCELISLVSATLHVASNRIYVTEARG